MADCPSLPKCPFFNDKMAERPAMAAMMKRNYCQTDNTHCARWMVFQKTGPGTVPANLYPNQIEDARALLR
jgi:hypothetical protein